MSRNSYGDIFIYSDNSGTIGSLFADYNSQISIHLTNNSTSINNVRVLNNSNLVYQDSPGALENITLDFQSTLQNTTSYSLLNILLQSYILDLSLILSNLSNKIYTNLT